MLRDQERTGRCRGYVGGQLLLSRTSGVAGPKLAHGRGADVGAHREGTDIAVAERADRRDNVGLTTRAHVPDRAGDAVGPAAGVAEGAAPLLERR